MDARHFSPEPTKLYLETGQGPVEGRHGGKSIRRRSGKSYPGILFPDPNQVDANHEKPFAALQAATRKGSGSNGAWRCVPRIATLS
ncbi:hypothetical protein GCM10011371_04000 [Novosphingobium marinum]|nr:hypothetical protein GCM10011371_04000 [Novosphingobium marinum]